MRTHCSKQRRGAIIGLGGACLLVAAGAVSIPRVLGGFSSAVSNSGDSLQTGSVQLTATSSGQTECNQGTSGTPISSTDTAMCTGTLLPTGDLPSSGSVSLSTTVTNQGSLPAVSASVVGGTCGAVDLADQSTSSDPMLVRNVASFAQPGPISGSASIGMTGTNSYAADIADMAGPSNSSFTIAIAFKTASTNGGTMIGFANTPTTSSVSNWDKMIWLDNSGHVVFGVWNGSTNEVRSDSAYNNNAWHLAVASMSTSNGLSLSVDGRSPQTNTNATSSQAYNGYWHVGWDNEINGWSDAPSDAYFNGYLADAAVFPSALSGTQISNLAGASSLSSWESALTSDGANYSWSLADTGTGVYTGALPGVSAPACDFADVTVGSSATETLATLATTPSALALPNPSYNYGFSVSPDSTYNSSNYPYASGLNLSLPLTIDVGGGGTFNAGLEWPREDVIVP